MSEQRPSLRAKGSLGQQWAKYADSLEAELKEAREQAAQYKEAARKCLEQWGQGRTEWTAEEQALKDLAAVPYE